MAHLATGDKRCRKLLQVIAMNRCFRAEVADFGKSFSASFDEALLIVISVRTDTLFHFAKVGE